MRTAKRVLIGTLVIAMLVCGLLVSSFAEGAVAPSLAEINNVLKYYEPATSELYENEDFNDGEYDADKVLVSGQGDEHTLKTIVDGGDDDYLSVKLGHLLNPLANADVTYGVNMPEGFSNFLIRYSFAAAHTDNFGVACSSCNYSDECLEADAPATCPRCDSELIISKTDAPIVSLYVSENERSDLNRGTALIKFNFVNGDVSYYNGHEYVTISGAFAQEGVWYDISVSYTGNSYKFSITYTAEGEGEPVENVFAVENAISPAYTLKAIELGCVAVDDNRESEILIDDVFVQAGIEDLYTGIDRVALIKNALSQIVALLADDSFSITDKVSAVVVYEKLVGDYADRLDKDAEVEALLGQLGSDVLEFYSSQLKEGVDSIDLEAGYAVRAKLLADYEHLAEKVREMLADAPSAEFEQMLVKYDAEVLAVAELAKKSEEFKAALIAVNEGTVAVGDPLYGYNTTIFSSDNYNDIKAFCELVDANYIFDATYTGYDGVYSSLYAPLLSRYEAMTEQCADFCEWVDAALDTELSLADRLAAYRSAYAYTKSSNSYYNNLTCPGIADRNDPSLGLIEGALTKYGKLGGLAEIAQVVDGFTEKVNLAEKSEYLPNALELIEDAKEYYESNILRNTIIIDYADTYRDAVIEAVESDKLRLDATENLAQEKYAAAQSYIAKVDALDGLTGDALIAAIEEALAAKKTGDIRGLEGVAEANAKLDALHKQVLFMEMASNKFIELVSKIDEATSLGERFVAINEAMAAQDDAEDSISGVVQAKSKLISAVAKYNEDINGLNAAYAKVEDNAAEISAVGTTATDVFAKVISFIKSLVD